MLDINKTGHYLANSATANNPENSNMLIKAQELPGTNIFLLSGWNNGGSFMYSGVLRDNTVTWKRTDNFGCNTAADLASLLGAPISFGLLQGSANNVTYPSAYACASGNTTDVPSDGILLTFVVKDNVILQVLYIASSTKNELSFRMKWYSTTWSSWITK